MITDSQIDVFRYRVFVLRDCGSQLLAIRSGRGLSLPEIQIPSFARAAESLATAIRSEWALEIICLYPPTETTGHVPSESHRPRYYLTEALQSQHTIPQAAWITTSSLTKDSLADGEDYQALLTSLAQCCPGPNSNPAPFGSMGWFETVCRWINDIIEPSGLYLNGEFRQFNASPAFSLIRFTTNRYAVWFKAVGEPNVREFCISQYLAETVPEFTPSILGTCAKWNAWLMPEVEGVHPDAQSGIEVWSTVARALARMQIASVGHALHLINAGCRDMRVDTLLDGFDHFFEAIACWTSHQTKKPTLLSNDELQNLGAQLKSVLLEFQAFDVPNSLGHLDLNPCNIVVASGRCVFLDWAEAYVGHPFLTFEYLRQQVRRFQSTSSWEAALTRAYAQEWLAFADPTSIRQALALSPLVARFVYLLSADCWRKPKHESAPEFAEYVGSLIRRIQRETQRLFSSRNMNGGRLPAFAESQEMRSCRS